MKINEIFKSIQGEGKYAGFPVLFIRLSGCNLNCDFCDSSYHSEGKEYSLEQIVEEIKKSNLNIIVWTGGEPTLQLLEIKQVMIITENVKHHIETNGSNNFNSDIFDYVCISPKTLRMAKRTIQFRNIVDSDKIDIKVVTDLELNKELIPYATMLMPLTTINEEIDKLTEQKVWNFCVESNTKFCLRQHVHVWGNKRGI